MVIEDRIEKEVIEELFSLGINVRCNKKWDWHMGSFQVCYKDKNDNLCTTVDPRRCGVADGLK
jgi:gamma-glutamyltranspeptidase/glutathione hydrolase